MTEIRNARPRLFIGSSREGKAVAEAIQLNLDGEIVAEVWSQGLFGLSETAIESLDQVSRDFDFAALVVTPDDVVESRGERQATPRDNIIFEAGLFMGRLGRDRTFFVCPKDKETRLPSDLAGLSVIRYSENGHRNLEAALGPAAARLRTAIKKFKEYRAALRPSEVARDEDPRPLVARPRRKNSLGTAAAQGPRQAMRIANISVTGALLETSGELPVGQILDLDLALDNGATIRVAAKVVRVQYPDWGRIGGVGVAFTSIPPESRQALEKFVEAA